MGEDVSQPGHGAAGGAAQPGRVAAGGTCGPTVLSTLRPGPRRGSDSGSRTHPGTLAQSGSSGSRIWVFLATPRAVWICHRRGVFRVEPRPL